jgi:hypothetical protein
MKSLVLTLLFFVTTPAWAMSDFDRAVLFGANLYSMGTYIARMEGEIARIKLDYEKQTAEFQQNLEKDYQVYLKETLNSELEYLKSQKAEYTQLSMSLKMRNRGFGKIIELANSVYKGLLSKESLLVELRKLNEAYPGAEADWMDLMLKSFGTADVENISAARYEGVLRNAIRLYAGSKALESDLNEQIAFTDLRISSTESQLKDLL